MTTNRNTDDHEEALTRDELRYLRREVRYLMDLRDRPAGRGGLDLTDDRATYVRQLARTFTKPKR